MGDDDVVVEPPGRRAAARGHDLAHSQKLFRFRHVEPLHGVELERAKLQQEGVPQAGSRLRDPRFVYRTPTAEASPYFALYLIMVVVSSRSSFTVVDAYVSRCPDQFFMASGGTQPRTGVPSAASCSMNSS